MSKLNISGINGSGSTQAGNGNTIDCGLPSLTDPRGDRIFILYHGHCPDGTGAALAAFLNLGNQATYIPVNYGTPPPPMPARSVVYIVDFSYPRDVLLEIMEANNRVIVLDHHATAEKDLAGLSNCHFDKTKAGAVLAWEFFHPGKEVPLLFRYLQDRDLWKFELPFSREVSAAIGSYPLTIEVLKNMLETSINEQEMGMEMSLTLAGKACLRLKQQQVECICKNARAVVFDLRMKSVEFVDLPGGFDLGDPCLFAAPVANSSVFLSEVGERLLELNPEAKFSGYYFDRADGKRQWGLRSRKSFDCSLIAKAMGGGGHPQAAGFQRDCAPIRY